MRSMTGYGRGECTENNRRFVVEIKAVNHRYNDITVKLPRTMFPYEDMLKRLVSEKVFRGKIDVYVNFETYSADDVSVKLNEAIADNYYRVLNTLAQRYSLEDKPSLELIAKFPDVVTVEKDSVSEEVAAQIEGCLKKAATEAIDSFVKMRTVEGENLKTNILEKLDTIKEAVDKINERAPMVSEDYRVRLLERLKEISEVELDEGRIATEVMLFADKACIDEEITRLYSHLEQMKDILNESVPVGRKLDFLVQEMNREVNTIGSKSNDLTITNIIVNTKSEIEKIREQVQNIE